MLLIIKVGDNNPITIEAKNDAAKTDKTGEPSKDRSSRKNKKKEKEQAERLSVKGKPEKKRLLVLPLGESIIALLLLVLLSAFYVVLSSFFSLIFFPFCKVGYVIACFSLAPLAVAYRFIP